MLGCQLTHTLLNLIAHTWPESDQLRSCTPCVPHAQSQRDHDQIRYSNINLSNFNVEDIKDAKTCLISLKSRSELRELPPNQLKLDTIWYPGYCWQRSKEKMVNYANELSGK